MEGKDVYEVMVEVCVMIGDCGGEGVYDVMVASTITIINTSSPSTITSHPLISPTYTLTHSSCQVVALTEEGTPDQLNLRSSSKYKMVKDICLPPPSPHPC